MSNRNIDRAEVERRLKEALRAAGESDETAERFLPLILADLESGVLDEADFASGLDLARRVGVRPKGES